MIREKELLHEIEELENKQATYQLCEKLSTLYIIYDHLYGKSKEEPKMLQEYSYAPGPEQIQTPEVKETKIILPSYQSYIDAKTDFQRGDISKEKVLRKLDTLSQELKEFVKMLYRNTDMPEEREKINALINDINVGNI